MGCEHLNGNAFLHIWEEEIDYECEMKLELGLVQSQFATIHLPIPFQFVRMSVYLYLLPDIFKQTNVHFFFILPPKKHFFYSSLRICFLHEW
jgi:hypothetical protein